jgi:hypothetical protein
MHKNYRIQYQFNKFANNFKIKKEKINLQNTQFKQIKKFLKMLVVMQITTTIL